MELGSIADWASAAGSVLASVIALYLAKSSQRISLSVTCGIRISFGNGIPQTELASIIVTNTGERQVKVSGIGLRHGLLKKNHGLIKIDAQTEHCENLFRVLNDGDTAMFGFPLAQENNWVGGVSKEFRNWLDLKTFRITIYCSNGQKVVVKPEKNLLDVMRNRMIEHRKSLP